MPHIIAPDLARGIGEPVGEHRRGRIEQQARAFERIAGDRDHARFLALHLAVGIHINDAVDLTGSVVLDPHRHAVRANFKIAGSLTFGNLGVKGRPFGA